MMLHHEIRPQRLAAYVLFLIGVLYVVFAIGHGRAGLHHFDVVAGVFVTPVPGWTPPPGPVPRGTPKWQVFIHAMCLPLSNTSLGTTGGWFGRAMNAPIDVFVARFSTRSNGPISILFKSIGFAVLATAIVPVTFLCLPMTLRRAKVRWAHVWRIGVYGAIAPAIVLSLFVMQVEDCTHRLFGLMLLVLPALLLVWWGLAVRHYLQVPHAWGVAASSVAIAVLTTAVVFYYVMPTFTGIIFGWY